MPSSLSSDRSVLFLLLLLLAAPLAAEPHLVTDLTTGPNRDPQTVDLVQSATVPDQAAAYFAASDPDHGMELWRTDGTAAGTRRITDVCAGRCAGQPFLITPVPGGVYFTADDGVSGRELWWSDGTPGSGHRVRDLCPGPCSTTIGWLQPLGDRLLFTVYDGQKRVLWSTDGTRAGTHPAVHLCDAVGDYDCVGFAPPRQVGGWVLFPVWDFVDNFPSGTHLWRTDGTAQGTGPLHDAVPSGEFRNNSVLVPLGGNLLFWTLDGLWRTDGTVAGTVLVKARNDLPLAADSFAGSMGVWNGALYTFFGKGEIVRSDGTTAGTMQFAKMPDGFRVTAAAPAASGLILQVIDPFETPNRIWRTAGTAGTTEEILDARPHYLGWETFASAGDRVLFAVSSDSAPSGRMDLWSTDGTAAGTQKIREDALSFSGAPFRTLDGEVLFEEESYDVARQLLGSDGTIAGTHLVRDFTAGLPAGGGPIEQTVLGSRLIYSAWLGNDAPALAVSDGTAGGTRPLAPASGVTWPGQLTLVAGHVFFSAGDQDVTPFALRRLWWTDGTDPGTKVILPLLDDVRSFSPLGSRVLFAARRHPDIFDLIGAELWTSNGTPAATRRVRDIDSYQIAGPHHSCLGESSNPGVGVALGNVLLFGVDDGWNGRELWRSDGTPAGTRLVRDINPGRQKTDPDREGCNSRKTLGAPSNPDGFVRYRNVLLFGADDGQTGRELWWTDGTAAGTRRVKDLRPGPQGSAPHDLTVFNGLVYFLASANGVGEALWRTNGTPQGTVLVHSLTLGTAPSWASHLTAARTRLYLSVYNETTGAELWTSRGTTTTTALVTDLRPGPGSAAPQFLTPIVTPVGDVLVFAADDGEHGVEPGGAMAPPPAPGSSATSTPAWTRRPLDRFHAWETACSPPPTMASTAASCGRFR
jgi:ELWxxDGT repeat protein